jgi:hypothetical protein
MNSIKIVDSYIRWYNEKRTYRSLPPTIEYRASLELRQPVQVLRRNPQLVGLDRHQHAGARRL